MSERKTKMTKWIFVAEDGNGKIHIFNKNIRKEKMGEDLVFDYQKEIQSKNLSVLCIYRKSDIIENVKI